MRNTVAGRSRRLHRGHKIPTIDVQKCENDLVKIYVYLSTEFDWMFFYKLIKLVKITLTGSGYLALDNLYQK